MMGQNRVAAACLTLADLQSTEMVPGPGAGAGKDTNEVGKADE